MEVEQGRYVERYVEGHKIEEFYTGENRDENEGKDEIQEETEKGFHGGLVAKGVEQSIGNVLGWRREGRETCSSDVKRWSKVLRMFIIRYVLKPLILRM